MVVRDHTMSMSCQVKSCYVIMCVMCLIWYDIISIIPCMCVISYVYRYSHDLVHVRALRDISRQNQELFVCYATNAMDFFGHMTPLSPIFTSESEEEEEMTDKHTTNK